MIIFYIELWNLENDHPYLAINEVGEVLKFDETQIEEATLKAQEIVWELNNFGEWMYFVTTHPSQFAVPLK